VSAADPAAALRRTPLWSRHVEAGARMVPFAGFDMPVVYSSILDEHRSVRARAGVFDVSHMGELRLRGPDTLALAQRLFTNDVAGTGLGRVRYGLLCLESGGVVDDVTLYRTGERELLFCVNASNIAADLAWPHYLVQAKAEPGNYGLVSLSPSVQATFSNLERAHGGRAPTFASGRPREPLAPR